VIERVLENWLTSLKERGQFDVCFRALLLASGYQPLGRKATHGPMERGKDIAAWHPKQRKLFLFQLKTGDIRDTDWNSMHTQLQQLVLVPFDHPNYTVGDPYKPVWVCTGEMTPAVQNSLSRQNADYRHQEKPEVEVWEQGKLIALFRDSLFAVQVLEVDVAIDHIRMWSHLTDYTKNEEELRTFFELYLRPVGQLASRERRRRLSGYLVCAAQLAQRYRELDDAYSAIDCVVLAAVELLACLARTRFSAASSRTFFGYMRELLRNLLDALVAECEAADSDIWDLRDAEGGVSEIFELPLRVHSLASKLALSAYLKEQCGEDYTTDARLLGKIVRGNVCFRHLLSERQMGTFLVALLGLLRYQHRDLGVTSLVQALRWVVPHYGSPKLPGLPSPYRPYTDIPGHWLGIGPQDTGAAEGSSGGQSYLLPLLIRLAAVLGQRGILEKTWQRVSRTVMEEYVPDSEADLYAHLPHIGRLKNSMLKSTHSWSALRKEARARPRRKLRRLAERYPEALLLLALARPWRAVRCDLAFYLPSLAT